MTKKEAVKILVLSPFYFRLPLVARRDLVAELCQVYSSLGASPDSD
jgi:hypothetical protein